MNDKQTMLYLKQRRKRIEMGGDFWDRACEQEILWRVAFFCVILAAIGAVLIFR